MSLGRLDTPSAEICKTGWVHILHPENCTHTHTHPTHTRTRTHSHTHTHTHAHTRTVREKSRSFCSCQALHCRQVFGRHRTTACGPNGRHTIYRKTTLIAMFLPTLSFIIFTVCRIYRFPCPIYRS